MVVLSTNTQLGLYAVAVSIGEVPSIIASAVRGVVLPSDAAEAERDSRLASQRLQVAARLTSFSTFVLAVILGVTCFWWLPWIFGQEFQDAIPATLVLLLASCAGSVGGAGLSARGKPELRSFSMGIAAFFNLAVFFLLIGPLGALGAAISTVVGNFVAGNLNLVWLSRYFDMPIVSFYGIRRSDISQLCSFRRNSDS